jgi:putative flippase GtrA
LLAVTPANGINLQSGFDSNIAGPAVTPGNAWLKLERIGDTVTGFTSLDGQIWTELGSTTVDLDGDALIGLFVSAHDGSQLSTATFDRVIVTKSTAGPASLPAPWTSGDVGDPRLAGSAAYAAGVFTVNGAGDDIWGDADQFQFVHRTLTGDGEIVARVTAQESGTNGWAKSGIMIKQSTAAGSPYALLAVTPEHGITFQYNFTGDGGSASYELPNAWLKLSRSGGTITGYTSSDGISWTEIGSMDVELGVNCEIGLFVSSHNGSQINTSAFDNVARRPLRGGLTLMTNSHAKLSMIKRMARFAIVGITCFLVQLGLLYLLGGLLHVVLADMVAFLFSAQLNFALSQAFTWRDRQHTEHLFVRWAKFNVSALLSVTAVNAAVFWLLVEAGLPSWLAMLIANIASTVWTFLVNHFVVFKEEQAATSPTPERVTMQALPLAEIGPPPSVALFMPAFNEGANLGPVVSKAYHFFDRAGITERAVIIVDDGSTDDTAAVVNAIRRTHPVQVVKHETNRGYGRALRSGFAAALDTGFDWVAYCDSDGQFNPGDLALLLLAAYSHRVDVVLGVRTQRADNFARRAAGRGWHSISRLVLKFNAADVDCGFKVLHRTAIGAIASELQSDFAAISPELLARLHRAGHRFVEVPVPHYPRLNGEQSGLRPKVILRSFGDLYNVRRDLSSRREAATTRHDAAAPVLEPLAPVLPNPAGQEAT